MTPYSQANIAGCSASWDPPPSLLCELTHPGTAQSRSAQHRQQAQDEVVTVNFHSLPLMQQFQPFHAAASASSAASASASRLSARRHRRKGAQVQEADGEDDESYASDDDKPASSSSTTSSRYHHLFAEQLVLRGLQSSACQHLLSDLDVLDPLDSRQLCIVEQPMRKAAEEGESMDAAAAATSCVFSAYACDAIGEWLRGCAAVLGSARRDAGHSYVKMQDAGGMSASDWEESRRCLQDKAEHYSVNTNSRG